MLQYTWHVVGGFVRHNKKIAFAFCVQRVLCGYIISSAKYRRLYEFCPLGIVTWFAAAITAKRLDVLRNLNSPLVDYDSLDVTPTEKPSPKSRNKQ